MIEAPQQQLARSSPTAADRARAFMISKATEITEFCVKHGGKCFEKWPVPMVFSYVLFHLVDGGCFVVRANGGIAAVMFAWQTEKDTVTRRHGDAESPFCWQRSLKNGDAIFVAEVIGDRARIAKLMKAAVSKWPAWRSKTVFTYRDGKLVELEPEVIMHFVLGRHGESERRGDAEMEACGR